MADSIKERMAIDWQKIKLEGGTRLSHIFNLYRDASREAMTQLRTGSQEISQIARDSVTTIAADLQSKPEATAVTTAPNTQVNEAQLSLHPAIETQVAAEMEPHVQPTRANTPSPVTAALQVAYTIAKAGWRELSSRYQQARLQADTQPEVATPLAEKQAVWETKAADLGRQAAHKEQHVRQQIKQFLQTASSRL